MYKNTNKQKTFKTKRALNIHMSIRHGRYRFGVYRKNGDKK